MEKFSLSDGKFLIRLARQAVESFLLEGKFPSMPTSCPINLEKVVGIFVTINEFPTGRLRGCIGYPHGFAPLIESCISASIKAAREDPRFYPISLKELDSVTFEITILSPMLLLDSNIPYEHQIEIGRDGLMVVCDAYGLNGLLLPQVATEWGFDRKTFLKEVCRKAGLKNDCMYDKHCKFFRFESQIFKEVSPKSEIKEEILNERNL